MYSAYCQQTVRDDASFRFILSLRIPVFVEKDKMSRNKSLQAAQTWNSLYEKFIQSMVGEMRKRISMAKGIFLSYVVS